MLTFRTERYGASHLAQRAHEDLEIAAVEIAFGEVEHEVKQLRQKILIRACGLLFKPFLDLVNEVIEGQSFSSRHAVMLNRKDVTSAGEIKE
jgi:hypothetical protein